MTGDSTARRNDRLTAAAAPPPFSPSFWDGWDGF
jgi:hypothetical protein